MKESIRHYFLRHREHGAKLLVALLFLLAALFILLNKENPAPLVIDAEAPLQTEVLGTDGEDNPSASEAKGEGGPSGEETAAEILVHVSGAVHNPGVIRLQEGARVYQAVELAGGMTDDADSLSINLARALRDEERIHVLRKGETPLPGGSADSPDTLGHGPRSFSGSSDPGGLSDTSDDLININTADSDTLQTLTGVGPSTAAKIIEYRQRYGPFRAPEQLKEVSGIGEKTYGRLRDRICI